VLRGEGSKSFDKAKDFVLITRSGSRFIAKNYRYDYFIFTRKVKAGVDAVQVLILGVECCLQLIIKNSLGNTSIRLSKLWQIMLQ
jgi:hypothetical protein